MLLNSREFQFLKNYTRFPQPIRPLAGCDRGQKKTK